MTTIAYKDNIIAYDSRMTEQDIIRDDDFNKKIERGGKIFFIGGTSSDFDEFFERYLSGDYQSDRLLNVFSLILDDGVLYESSIDPQNRIWKCELDLKKYSAFGSGDLHALTAMDLGCSAKEAVFMAACRDSATGGKINTYKVCK